MVEKPDRARKMSPKIRLKRFVYESTLLNDNIFGLPTAYIPVPPGGEKADEGAAPSGQLGGFEKTQNAQVGGILTSGGR